MIPILFEQNEKEFTSLGIGGLVDCISCKVTEERNGTFEASLVYPVNGQHFSEISVERIVLVVPSEGANAQPFRIYKITRPLNGKVTVKAQHISYDLSKYTCKPFSALNCTDALNGLFRNSYEPCPFYGVTDKPETDGFSLNYPATIRSILGGVEGSILDVFGGGEYEFDGFKVILHAQRGEDRGMTVLYGKNLVDASHDESSESTYTALVPYWAGENGTVCADAPIYSGHESAYGRPMTIPFDLSSEFETEPTKAQLESKARSYMQNNSTWNFSETIKVKYVPSMGEVRLCDTVTVHHPVLGISLKQKVIKTVYDALKERYDSIEIGNAKSTSLYSAISQQITSNQTYTDMLVITKGNREMRLQAGGIYSKGADGNEVSVQPQVVQVSQGQHDATMNAGAFSISVNDVIESQMNENGLFVRKLMLYDGDNYAEITAIQLQKLLELIGG